MAVTDDQLIELKSYARQLKQDGVLNDPSDKDILIAVLDMAELDGMRTEDEFAVPIEIADIPDVKDQQDICRAYDWATERSNNDDN
jgi:hypothetical protein